MRSKAATPWMAAEEAEEELWTRLSLAGTKRKQPSIKDVTTYNSGIQNNEKPRKT